MLLFIGEFELVIKHKSKSLLILFLFFHFHFFHFSCSNHCCDCYCCDTFVFIELFARVDCHHRISCNSVLIRRIRRETGAKVLVWISRTTCINVDSNTNNVGIYSCVWSCRVSRRTVVHSPQIAPIRQFSCAHQWPSRLCYSWNWEWIRQW